MIYANHAATSWPKPPEVLEAVDRALREPPCEVERSGAAGGRDVRTACREALATLFNAPDPAGVILTGGSTHALNLLLDGLLRDGGHAVTTTVEHNSVLRPLFRLRKESGAQLTLVACDGQGRLDPDDIVSAMTPATKAVVVNHSSNVTGAVADLAPVGAACRERGIPFVVDASQSAGCQPVDMEKCLVDALAFAGHKGLGGPAGVGGAVLSPNLRFRPIMVGGTGIRSDLLEQPATLPLLYEAGTPNFPGIAGLEAGVRRCLRTGVAAIGARLQDLMDRLWSGLEAIDGARLFGGPPKGRAAVQSFLLEGMDPADTGYVLQESYGIVCRAGLHCAPLVHKALGTEEKGTVRLSLGFSNTEEEVDRMVEAAREMAAALKSRG